MRNVLSSTCRHYKKKTTTSRDDKCDQGSCIDSILIVSLSCFNSNEIWQNKEKSELSLFFSLSYVFLSSSSLLPTLFFSFPDLLDFILVPISSCVCVCFFLSTKISYSYSEVEFLSSNSITSTMTSWLFIFNLLHLGSFFFLSLSIDPIRIFLDGRASLDKWFILR